MNMNDLKNEVKMIVLGPQGEASYRNYALAYAGLAVLVAGAIWAPQLVKSPTFDMALWLKALSYTCVATLILSPFAFRAVRSLVLMLSSLVFSPQTARKIADNLIANEDGLASGVGLFVHGAVAYGLIGGMMTGKMY